MHLLFAAARCNGSSNGGLISASSLPQACADDVTLKTIFFVAFGVIGGLATFFLILAGARYTLSQGNPEAMQKSKNQIQYSLIGLIIVASAAGIINFIIDRLK